MSDSIKESTWLLTEHLRYTPLSLVDDIINSINALLYRAVSAVEAGLLNAPAASLGFKCPRKQQQSQQAPWTEGEQEGKGNDEELTNGWYPEAKLEIENGVHQLETLFEATVDKDFDKLEIYVLRNILTVPEEIAGWIRLGHYENLDFSPPPDAPTIESLNLQRRKLEETRKLHRALVHESKRNAALIAQLHALLPSASTSSRQDAGDVQPEQASPFKFLTSHPVAQSLSIGSSGNNDNENQPLTTTTAFVTSQIPSLRALVEVLRPKLNSLATTPVFSDDHEGNKEDERALYIETQTRRHLTSTRGLELDEQGAVKIGGDDEVGGKRMDMESVRGLEEVVGVLREAMKQREEQNQGVRKQEEMRE